MTLITTCYKGTSPLGGESSLKEIKEDTVTKLNTCDKTPTFTWEVLYLVKFLLCKELPSEKYIIYESFPRFENVLAQCNLVTIINNNFRDLAHCYELCCNIFEKLFCF